MSAPSHGMSPVRVGCWSSRFWSSRLKPAVHGGRADGWRSPIPGPGQLPTSL